MTTVDWYFYFVALKGHLEQKLEESEGAACLASHGYLGDLVETTDRCLDRLAREITFQGQQAELRRETQSPDSCAAA